MAFRANFSCFNENLSAERITPTVWKLNQDISFRYITIFVSMFLVLVGVPWNTLVIALIARTGVYKKKPTTVLLLNLAFIDLIICLFIPFYIISGVTGEFSFGSSDRVRCKVCQIGIIFVAMNLNSLINLATISVDRLVYLRSAMTYHMKITSAKLGASALFGLVFSTAVSMPILFGFGEMRFSTATGICSIAFSGSTHLTSNKNYLIFLSAIILIPVAIITISTTWVMCIVQRHLGKRSKHIKTNNKMLRTSFKKKMKRNHNAAQFNFVIIHIGIIIVNIISWLPILIRIIIGGTAPGVDEYSNDIQIFGSISFITLLSQSVVHPILQVFLIREIRTIIIDFFKKIAVRTKCMPSTVATPSSTQTHGKDNTEEGREYQDGTGTQESTPTSDRDSHTNRSTSSPEHNVENQVTIINS